MNAKTIHVPKDQTILLQIEIGGPLSPITTITVNAASVPTLLKYSAAFLEVMEEEHNGYAPSSELYELRDAIALAHKTE